MTFLNRSHRVAAICGGAPLLLGTAIFLLWLVTRWSWLVGAGGVVLYGGLVAFAVGVVSLGLAWRTARRNPGIARRSVRVSTLGCAGLLLANFPVAAGILSAGLAIATRYSVVVHNASPQRLEGVRASGGGCDASYGSLLPGTTATRSFWIRQDGQLVFRASSGGGTLEQVIDGYVSNNDGGHVTVTVRTDQTITIARYQPQDFTVASRVRDAMFWLDRSPC